MAGNLVPSSSPTTVDAHNAAALQHGGAYPPAPVESSDGIQWSRYLSALARYKWLILLITLVGTAIGVAITRFIDPEYVTRTTLTIDGGGGKNGPIRPASLVGGFGWIELLRSFAVIDSVVQREALFATPDSPDDAPLFRGMRVAENLVPGGYKLVISGGGRQYTLLDEDGQPVDAGAVGDSIGRPVGFQWQPAAAQLGQDREIKFDITTPRDASVDLQQNLNTSMPEESNFLRVSLSGTNPRRLSRTLNAIDTQFVQLAADLKRAKLTEMSRILKEQLDTAAAQLASAESRLQNFRTQVITLPSEQGFAVAPGIQSTQAPAITDFFQKKVALEQLKRDRAALQATIGRARNGDVSVEAFQTIGAAQNSPNLNAALQELSASEAELRALRYRYTDEHKPVQDVRERMDSLRTQTIPRYASALVTELQSRERELQQDISAQSTELREIPARTIEENRLQREVGAKANLFADIQSRYETNRLAEASAFADISILDVAVPPRRPTSNTAPRIILMAFAASLGAALALALLLDQLDKRFRYPEQVTKELGLSILGAVPAIRKSNGRQLSTDEAAQVVEAFRTIRLNLAHSYGSAGPVLLTVSSPGPGDGKSLVSSNLALSFAEAGYKTLLVDGDTRRGELHRMFSLDRRPGLLDYLVGDASMESIIKVASHDGLSVIPCGTRRQQGPELLGSAAMSSLMGAVKTQFNVVIVDSPPLGAGIDPFVLGTATGHMLMVFRSGETDRAMAEAKLKLLDRLPVRVLGAVLNDIRTEGVYRYYSYLYGYSADEEATGRLAAESAEVSSKA